jgi:hypothetical protein
MGGDVELEDEVELELKANDRKERLAGVGGDATVVGGLSGVVEDGVGKGEGTVREGVTEEEDDDDEEEAIEFEVEGGRVVGKNEEVLARGEIRGVVRAVGSPGVGSPDVVLVVPAVVVPPGESPSFSFRTAARASANS